MRKFLMLVGALALLLASWIMPVQTAEAMPYICSCGWTAHPSCYDCWNLEEEIWWSCEGYNRTFCQP